MAKYYTDWTDGDFPEIKFYDPKLHKERETPRGFGECKREIRDHFTSEIEHARNQLEALSKLRMSDITKP
jgi:hypothetical protein